MRRIRIPSRIQHLCVLPMHHSSLEWPSRAKCLGFPGAGSSAEAGSPISLQQGAASTRPCHVGVDGVAPAPEPKLAVACSEWEEKVPSATVVGLARWAPRTARCPLSLLPTCRSLSCSSCPGLSAGNGHCQVVGLWRCLFPPSQANGCAICEIVATLLASMRGVVGSLGCDRAMRSQARPGMPG